MERVYTQWILYIYCPNEEKCIGFVKSTKMTTEHMIFGVTRCCEGIGIRVLGNQGDQIFQFFQKIADEV